MPGSDHAAVRRLPPLLRCPTCAATLAGDGNGGLVCDGCGEAYPSIGDIPLLVPDPADFITRRWTQILAAMSDAGLPQGRIAPLRPYVARTRIGEQRPADFETVRGVDTYTAAQYDPAVTETLAGVDRILTAEARVPLLSRVAQAIERHVGGRDDLVTVDLGANVGGGMSSYAPFSRLVLGIDLSVRAALRASSIMSTGVARYMWQQDGRTEIERAVDVDVPAQWCYVLGDCLRVPVASDCADVVTCLNVLELVDSPQALLDEAARILRPGGLFALVSPYSWHARIDQPSAWLDGGMHGSSSDAVREQLARRGWEIVEEQPAVAWLQPAIQRSVHVWIVDFVLARLRSDA